MISPVRNEIADISRALTSLKRQSFEDWRVLFLDNGSTDGTYEFLLEQRDGDSRILVQRNSTSLPIHESFTVAFRLAQSLEPDFVQILAGDDALGSRRYLEAAIESIERNQSDFACGSILHFDQFANLIHHQYLNRAARRRSTWSWNWIASQHYEVCNLMYSFIRGETFFEITGETSSSFTNNLSSDWWFALSLGKRSGVYDNRLEYRKFRKEIPYSHAHYSQSHQNPKVEPHNRYLEWLRIGPRQLGDRLQQLGRLKGFGWLLLFTLREVRKLVRRSFKKS